MTRKRLFDLCVIVIIMAIFLPVYIFIGLGIFLSNGLPIIFKQKRIGYRGQIFTIYKFRTLCMSKEKNNDFKVVVKNDYRVFPFGRLLRSTYMDELPQCVNVLRGDMSIVGPRPMMQGQRFEQLQVKPGCTSLAKVSMSGNEKTETISKAEQYYDDIYAKHNTRTGDVCIIVKTLIKVLKHDGI